MVVLKAVLLAVADRRMAGMVVGLSSFFFVFFVLLCSPLLLLSSSASHTTLPSHGDSVVFWQRWGCWWWCRGSRWCLKWLWRWQWLGSLRTTVVSFFFFPVQRNRCCLFFNGALLVWNFPLLSVLKNNSLPPPLSFSLFGFSPFFPPFSPALFPPPLLSSGPLYL